MDKFLQAYGSSSEDEELKKPVEIETLARDPIKSY